MRAHFRHRKNTHWGVLLYVTIFTDNYSESLASLQPLELYFLGFATI